MTGLTELEIDRLTAQQDTRDFTTARRSVVVGLGLNIVLSAVKFVGGTIGNSQAVVADAVHSISDCSTDIAVLIGMRYWSKPPDHCHPHGHGRIETLVTVAIGMVLAGVAVGLGYNALVSLQSQDSGILGWPAFIAAVISIFAKEGIYRWTVAVGKRAKSPAVIANAWHHRSDSLSSVPAALAVAAAKIDPDWAFIDGVGAIVVSLFILQAAWRIAKPSLGQLVDRGSSDEELARINAIVQATDGVEASHALRTRHVGSGLQVDLHVLVDGELPVREGHNIAGAVKTRLLARGPDVVDVIVHVEPSDQSRRRKN